ncbi:MAG: hypothetical protein ACR2MD_15470 [Aridibacter sp.]
MNLGTKKVKRSLGNYFNAFFSESPGKATKTTNADNVSEMVKGNENKAFTNGATVAPLDIKAEVTTKKKINVSAYLRKLQTSGIRFHTATDYFETGGRTLTGGEREQLQAMAGEVLCTLHQMSLQKYIFDKFPELLEQFKFEVIERQAIIAETDKPDARAEYMAIQQTSFFWFCDYLGGGNLN